MLCCGMATIGCEPPPIQSGAVPAQPADHTQSPDVAKTIWQPLPKRIRVYPSTRFVRESDQAILEARFELFDEMGDPVKAPGSFRIELHSVDEVRGGVPKQLLYSWNADTTTIDQQREHYDPITRGYLFRLGVDNLRVANQPTLLKVIFTQTDKPRLEAEEVIRADW